MSIGSTSRAASCVGTAKALALSAGPGASDALVVVGTDKGDVLAFDTDGKALWTARIASEVIAPPRISDKVVIVFSGDGKIYGLAAADGKRLWVDARTNPPLTIRNAAGGTVSRGGRKVRPSSSGSPM